MWEPSTLSALRACLTVLSVATFSTPSLGATLECPDFSTLTIKEPARTMLAQRRALQDRGGLALPQLVYELRANHPQSPNGEVTNYLLALYCPIVNADNALTKSAKTQKMNQFAGEVRAQEH